MTARPARLFAATCWSSPPAARRLGSGAAGVQRRPCGTSCRHGCCRCLGVVSLLAFVLAQLPFMVAAVAIATMARGGSPRLAIAGGAVAVIGGFGHAVFGGIGLAYLAMSGDASTGRSSPTW